MRTLFLDTFEAIDQFTNTTITPEAAFFRTAASIHIAVFGVKIIRPILTAGYTGNLVIKAI
ncbi:MAG: hypothetical protein KDK34_06605, partial [Leptospiraceae bacterium]|nr:hypothetical protein [Leptospiraceae bacterium]